MGYRLSATDLKYYALKAKYPNQRRDAKVEK
jgi:hypothetical protein